MRLAIVKNGRVKNIIVGDSAKFPQHIDVTNIPCGIGWLDNGDGTFTNDIVIIPPEPSKIQEVELLLTQALAKLRTIR
jgi:hypothetical protein